MRIRLSIVLTIVICSLMLVSALITSNCDQLLKLQFSEEKVYSQNGEDGVLVALLNMINVKYRSFVEFGVSDGRECNTRILWQDSNFQGLMMDGGNVNTAINLQQEFITESNVLDIFDKYNISKNFDVLSVDVDMFDYWILARLLRDGQYRPRIMIVETNPTLCLNKAGHINHRDYSRLNAEPLTVVHPNMTDQTVWDLSRYSGGNPASFQQLGKEFGYEMVYCERCGVNCFLVLRSELPEVCQLDFGLPMIPYPCFGTARTGGAYPGHEIDPLERSVVNIDKELLLKIKSGDYSIFDIQRSMLSCHSNHTRRSMIKDQEQLVQ
jgi:hypothetical protein